MTKEILHSNNARDLIVAGANKLVNAVKVTLGPKGRNVVLSRGFSTPLITNDGVTIAKEIELENPFENLGASIIKEVCVKTNDIAGDGTTTASVLAQSILNEGIKNFTAGANPILLKQGILSAIDVAVEHLKTITKKVVSEDEIKQVATISAGDESIGEIISDAMKKVGKNGSITLEDSNQTYTDFKVVEGMQINRGFVSPYMCTDNAKQEITLNNPYILITTSKISNINDILHILEQISNNNSSLLIIAEDVEGDALATLVLNKVRGNLNAVAIKAPSFGDRRINELSDIATFVDGNVISSEYKPLKEASLEDLGRAKSIIVGKDTTTIIQGNGEKTKVNDRINLLLSQLDFADNTYDKDTLNERISKLSGGVAVIRVGATTEVELKEKKLRVEDALNATKSAVKEGIVAGGGLALLLATGKVLKFASMQSGDLKTGAEIVATALSSPLKQICINAGVEPSIVIEKIKNSSKDNYGYNAMNDEFCDMFQAGIIDPTLVTRSALQNAGSIASIMLTTECAVCDKPSAKT